MRRSLQRWLPSEETLCRRRSLRWLAPLLRRPWLWQLSRRRVAAGAAIGVFFAFLMPILQIATAAAVAVALRANVPAAAAATLISNPLTYVPIFVLAYRTGASAIGESFDASEVKALARQIESVDVDPERWTERLRRIGKPLLVGLALFAICGAVLTWALVNLVWIAAVRLKRRRSTRGAAPTG